MKAAGSLSLTLKFFKADDNKAIDGGSGRANKTVINSFKKLTHMPNIRTTKEPTFLIPNVKKVFDYLRQTFFKTLIFKYFDQENHIWIETYASAYIIS